MGMNTPTVLVVVFEIAFIGLSLSDLPNSGFLLANQIGNGQESNSAPVEADDDRQISRTWWTENSIDTRQGMRWYRVSRPESCVPGNPAVVLMHGGTHSMRKIFERSNDATGRWKKVAEREGLLLIVPNGSSKNAGPNGDRQNWNDLRKNDIAKPAINDVEFIATLIESMKNSYAFDSSRVYVTGASNGGMMTFRLLIEKPELFAAGVAFVASLPEDYSEIERPETTTPLLMCNGTNDPLIR